MDGLCRWIRRAGAEEEGLDAYRRMASKAGKIWREHGALEFRECVADDVKSRQVDVVSAQRQAQAERDGGVLLDNVYKSRAHRDRVNAKVMKDKRLGAMMDGKRMPFDGKRMIYGGFKVLVEA